ncbi:MAG TPA: gliding motility-associated ABC transporter substrate-binding protein GldG [Flavisolibacter sp.]|nr:gliding motility-associated ABC transporter substrate-binding protein GldG [Flavisolibacter sp.]
MKQQRKPYLWWIALLCGLVILNVAASLFHKRFDLTEEKRYSLSQPTKALLRELEQPVQIDIFLTGNDLPAVVRKFRNSLNDFLFESKEYGRNNLQFNFIDPFAGDTAQVRSLLDTIGSYGLTPVEINAPSSVGDELKIKRLVHGALVRYGGKTVGVDLLKGVRAYGTEPEELAALYNNVEATLEYKFASAIQKVTSTERPLVGYLLGNGEAWGYNVDDAVRTLISEYQFDTVNIKQVPYIQDDYDALLINKPTQAFTDADKLKIDQYVMRGGKVMWLLDNMFAEFDSLYQSNGFVAFDRGLNLEDMLFTYGVRINQMLVQDMQSDKLPQVSADGQQRRMVDWPFFPILNGTDHPISKNLDGIRAMFPTTLDTVEATGISKTVLLETSNNTRLLSAPAKIDFEFLQIAPDQKLFRSPATPIAVLLEGNFRSLYTGRVPRATADSLKQMNRAFKQQADTSGKMIIVADGDLAMNQFSPNTGPLPMGMNLFTRYTFANKDFFVNSLEYLVNPTDILQTRSKEYTLRLLDPRAVNVKRTTWQLINIALPILLIIVFGIIYTQLRKRRYAS